MTALAAALALILATAPPAAPPAGAVALTVLARGTRQPLAGATVIVDGVPAGETDGAGRLVLSLPPGAHQLQVQSSGYLVDSRPVDAGVATSLLVRLEPSASALTYETVVRAAPAAGAVSLDRQEITRTPGSLGDPFRVIESLPGVTPIVWPAALYSVRGTNPGNTGFLVDGLRVPALFHFALGPAVIHPYFLGGLDFYAGSSPIEHGRFVGGLVAASTAAPPTDRAHGSADVRLFDAGGIVTVPFDGGRGTVAVAGRYGYPGALLTALDDNISLQYWDYQARADHDLGPGRLTLFAFGSFDALTSSSSSPLSSSSEFAAQEQKLVLTFHRVDLHWAGAMGAGRLRAGLAAGLDRTELPSDENDRLSTEARRLIPRLSYDRAVGAASWHIGVDGEWTRHRPQVSAASSSELATFALPRTVRLAGAWTSLRLALGSRVVVTPGLRLDDYQEGGVQARDLGPRLEVRVRASDAVTVKASGGRVTQMPSFPLELPGFEGFGLAALGLQSAWQGAVGVEARLPAGIGLDASSFAHRYVLTDIRDPRRGNPLLADFLTRRDALSYGLEIMIRRPPTARTYGWISYTLSRSLRAFEGGVVTDADWDQRHVLNVVAGHRWRRYTFGGRFHLHSGRPVTIDGALPLEFGRLPPFSQLDLRVERRVVYDRFTLDLYLETVNTTATRQVVSLQRTAAGLHQDSFRIILPSLGVRGEF